MEIVKNGECTSDFGDFRPLLPEPLKKHDGIDIVSKTGDTRVFSPVSGIVVYDFDTYEHAKRWTGAHTGGNMVIVKLEPRNRYDSPMYLRFLHLVQNMLSIGQKVRSGTLIGNYGDVGAAVGGHLHIDLCDFAWRKVNPRNFVAGIPAKRICGK